MTPSCPSHQAQEKRACSGGDHQDHLRLGSGGASAFGRVPSQTINISFVERNNLTYRQCNGRLSRKVLSFSKDLTG